MPNEESTPVALEALSGNSLASANAATLSLSPPLEAFLKEQGLDPQTVARSSLLSDLSNMDTSHPLSAYFISSSHNTYLASDQLAGKATADQYTKVLLNGARCVEIDAWPSEPDEVAEYGEIKVTHGWTLTQKLPFKKVCEAIVHADDRDKTPFPIVISLECHVPPEKQPVLVQTMQEVFKDRLVTKKLDGRDQITLAEAMNKILVKVEHIGPWPHALSTSTKPTKPDSDSESDAEQAKAEKAKPAIIEELSRLGVYTTSIKPVGDDFLAESDPPRPSNLVVNISEKALGKLLPTRFAHILEHNSLYGMRVYPHGLRVLSRNLNPLPFWRSGAQICALNFQTFDRGVQMNGALFAGTHGWLLKPAELRKDASGSPPREGRLKLKVSLKGATGLHVPKDAKKEGLHPYVVARLFVAEEEKSYTTRIVQPAADDKDGANPIFDEEFSFEYNNQVLAFLRLKVVHKDGRFSKDDTVGLAMINMDRVKLGEWRLLPIMELSGAATKSSLLVKFDLESVA